MKSHSCAIFVLAALLYAAPASADFGLYAEIMITPGSNDATMVVYGTAENYNCTEEPGVNLDVYLFDPAMNLLANASDYNGGCSGAATTPQHVQSLDSWVDGQYIGKSAVPSHGCAQDDRLISIFSATFAYSGFDPTYNKHVYMRDTGICSGGCQPVRHCSTEFNSYLIRRGLYVRPPTSPIGGCLFIFKNLSSSPSCSGQPSGFVFEGSYDDEC